MVLAQDCGSTATNAISTFTHSKIGLPSPERFLSNRAEHLARQINSRTKDRNLTWEFFLHSLSLKWYWLYSFERSTLFTTTILKRVLFLWRIFWKMYSYSFHDCYFYSFEKIFYFILSDVYSFENSSSLAQSSINWRFWIYWWLNSLT